VATVELSEHSRQAVAADVRGLPAQLSSFVGRERELTELDALLAEFRLVTLTGAGGSGKTRLALEAAERVSGRIGQPATFVDFAPITDPALAVSTIAAALGVRERLTSPLLATLLESLRPRQLLLLLDNLEHLLPAAAGPVSELLAACPRLRILSTSRIPLRIRGEREYPVDPLGLPVPADLTSPDRLAGTEAVELFVQRAQASDPHFALTSANAHAVAAICRRLDGLPLAIELAAGQSKVLAPDALLHRLERRLPLLTSGAADAPARQRTLRDAIAWSYDLLALADQLVFAQLSVFVGGFSLTATDAVVMDPRRRSSVATLNVLGRLVDHSLVRVAPDVGGEPRFRILETIREFALEHLQKSERDALRARHGEHFTLLAEEAEPHLFGPEGAPWLARLMQDLDNLRAALEAADDLGDAERLCRLVVALMRFLWESGHHQELGRWLHAAETVASDVDRPLQGRVLHYVAQYELAHSGDRDRSKRLLTESLAIYQSLGDRTQMARALAMLADVHSDLGELGPARNSRTRALALVRELADPADSALLLAALGWSFQSVALVREAIDLGRKSGDSPAIATGLGYLAIRALIDGDAATAIRHLSECARTWRELDSTLPFMWTTARLGTAPLRAGEIEAARNLLVDALAKADEVGTVWSSLSALEGAADWLGVVGRPEPATVCWAAVDAIQSATLDRTDAHVMGLFIRSRERDRSALSDTEYESARSRGAALTLDEAVDYAIQMLDQSDLAAPRTPATGSAAHGRHDLTPREREVLQLLAIGRSDGEIAAALYISKKTAAVHVANIKGKLGADSRVEIVTTAMRRGLVPAP
jgi:predicted ATPase/DNA-binding CsgD family transcriptional regulator